jgi:membrane-bound lytic murein transglycosylase B
MYNRKLQFGGLLLSLLLAMPAWTQTARYSVPAASVEDAFSAYHQALSGAADSLIAAAARPAPGSHPQALEAGTQHSNDRGVRQFAERYWDGQQTNVRRAVERVALLRPTLDPILHEAGVPVDVAALVLVESGGRPTAISPKGALGIWQFMPETARRYGLVVTPALDERTDVVKSTHAAARYLRDLHTRFGEWNLAFAAYNAGEGAVQRAMRHGASDFETMSRGRQLPLETRNYVPAVLAAVNLLDGASPVPALIRNKANNARVIYADSAPIN